MVRILLEPARAAPSAPSADGAGFTGEQLLRYALLGLSQSWMASRAHNGRNGSRVAARFVGLSTDGYAGTVPWSCMHSSDGAPRGGWARGVRVDRCDGGTAWTCSVCPLRVRAAHRRWRARAKRRRDHHQDRHARRRSPCTAKNRRQSAGRRCVETLVRLQGQSDRPAQQDGSTCWL